MRELIRITVNGELHEVEQGASVADWLAARGIDPKSVVVERNREIVPRSQWAGVRLAANDQMEIVGVVGGG